MKEAKVRWWGRVLGTGLLSGTAKWQVALRSEQESFCCAEGQKLGQRLWACHSPAAPVTQTSKMTVSRVDTKDWFCPEVRETLMIPACFPNIWASEDLASGCH